jgi:hypothetical protein
METDEKQMFLELFEGLKEIHYKQKAINDLIIKYLKKMPYDKDLADVRARFITVYKKLEKVDLKKMEERIKNL